MSKKKILTESEILKLSRFEQLKLSKSELLKLSNEGLLSLPMACIQRLSLPKARDATLMKLILSSSSYKKLHRMLDDQKSLENALHRELTGGDEDFYRVLLEMRKITGLNVNDLMELTPREFYGFLKAKIRKPVTAEQEKKRGLELWNEGMTWRDVNAKLGRDPDQINATRNEIRRCAEKNKLPIRKGKQGRPAKK